MTPRASLVFVAAALAAPPASAEVGTTTPAARPWLGIGFDDLGGAARITEVHPGTAAATAGLQPGDEIVAIDGDYLSSLQGLPELVSGRQIGDRLPITFFRDGRRMKVRPRLTAKPSTEEIVYRRLVDRLVPAVTLYDVQGATVPATEWMRQPQAWIVFDVRCDRCAADAAALAARLTEEAERGEPSAPVRVVLVGRAQEAAAYLARVPVLGTVWRVDRDEPLDVSTSLGGLGMRPAPLGRRLISGVDPDADGVTMVLDEQGVVRYATALSAGEAAHTGACAAAARVARWRR